MVNIIRPQGVTQEHMFYRAQRQIADANLLFLELVEDGLTREELQTNINRRPSLWSRYVNWLDKLPSKAQAQPA